MGAYNYPCVYNPELVDILVKSRGGGGGGGNATADDWWISTFGRVSLNGRGVKGIWNKIPVNEGSDCFFVFLNMQNLVIKCYCHVIETILLKYRNEIYTSILILSLDDMMVKSF